MPPRHWLSPVHPLTLLLRPVAWVFGTVRALRERFYDWGIFKAYKLPIPVIVVGNVVAGGVGKTPVVIDLVNRLTHMGYQPGVVSRGYGRKNKKCQLVTSASTSADVGDEPLLIAQACQAPVVAASNRVEASKALLAAHPECNVIVSDDGLQHLALGRDMEIVLFDERGVGNNYLLPAGPLREPWPRRPRCRAHLVLNNVPRRLAEYAVDENGQHYQLSSLAGQTLCAVAGIAKPQNFFDLLLASGLAPNEHLTYPDHADFAKENTLAKLTANPNAIWLCTEKDAVKLWPLANALAPDHVHRILTVPLVVDLDAHFLSVFDVTIQSLMQSSKPS